MRHRGDTVLMAAAGAGHVNPFHYFVQRILEGRWKCQLGIVKDDGRNLYSIAGLAHDEKKGERKYVNKEIQHMVKDLVKYGYVGLRLRTSA